MEKHFTFTNRTGGIVKAVFYSLEDGAAMKGKRVDGVQGYCFHGDKLVIVYSAEKGYWSLPGGGVEQGESVEQALEREVKEETNMKVLSQRLIGYQDLSEPDKDYRQTRSVCIVEPYGDFVSDPAGDITEIRLIDPKELTKYIDWGEVGDYCLRKAEETVNNQA
jgi:ADP-ribose pyrophosphatase YjhB (NUDIX family)